MVARWATGFGSLARVCRAQEAASPRRRLEGDGARVRRRLAGRSLLDEAGERVIACGGYARPMPAARTHRLAPPAWRCWAA
jgi:hypothetical protein